MRISTSIIFWSWAAVYRNTCRTRAGWWRSPATARARAARTSSSTTSSASCGPVRPGSALPCCPITSSKRTAASCSCSARRKPSRSTLFSSTRRNSSRWRGCRRSATSWSARLNAGITDDMSARVDAGAATVHWGYLDATLAPVAAIDSGDVVTISTVSGPPDALPPPPAIVPRALHDIHAAKTRRMLPGHMCTGPIAVRGAKPGQVLQVDIEDIALHYDWGYVACRPLRGALPHDFAEPHMIHVALERNRMVGRLPWGTDIPLRPFFGVIASAPPRDRKSTRLNSSHQIISY